MKLLYYYHDSNPYGTLIAIALALVLIYLLFVFRKKSYYLEGDWLRYTDDFFISSQTFYQEVEKSIKLKAMPGVTMSRVKYYETNFFSAEREYFRVVRGKAVFDFCAAPFGKSFFISCRQGWFPSIRERIVAAFPFIGIWLARKLFKRTYYQIDSHSVFIAAVQDSVLDTFQKAIDGKGPLRIIDTGTLFPKANR